MRAVVLNSATGEGQSRNCNMALLEMSFDLCLQNCESLWLRGGDGSRFRFAGVCDVVKGNVAPDTILVPPDPVGSGNDPFHCEIPRVPLGDAPHL
jgi:hypothetical protein